MPVDGRSIHRHVDHSKIRVLFPGQLTGMFLVMFGAPLRVALLPNMLLRGKTLSSLLKVYGLLCLASIRRVEPKPFARQAR